MRMTDCQFLEAAMVVRPAILSVSLKFDVAFDPAVRVDDRPMYGSRSGNSESLRAIRTISAEMSSGERIKSMHPLAIALSGMSG
jgi:hypothetical protein